jgi:polysaccharide biosynthesis/export protein
MPHPPKKLLVPLWYCLIGVLLLTSCKTQNLFQTTKGKSSDTKYNGKRKAIAANPVTDSSFFAVTPDYQYKIRKDDKVNISVWDHDDLSVGSLYGIYNSNEVYGKWLLVNVRGEINVPQIGLLKVKGLTIIDVEDTLRRLYAQWIKTPIVDVKVLNKEITVIGEMKSPGKFLVEKDNNTLIEMLAKAGDFDFYANKKAIKVIRVQDGAVKEITIDLTRMENYLHKNIQLIPGDVVYVPSKKGKDFDKRIATIIPFASIATAFAITYGTFF